MRRASMALSVITLLCSPLLGGQTQQTIQAHQLEPGKPAVERTMPSPFSSCPVGLTAEQAHDGALAYAGSSGSAVHAEQVLDLSFSNTGARRIVGAQIEVHGTSVTRRVVPLGSGVADAVRTVHVDESVPANQQRTHRVIAPELSSVEWIDLIELRYADGTSWHAGEGKRCRAEPNPILRVAEAR
jgi:hypothetical protein